MYSMEFEEANYNKHNSILLIMRKEKVDSLLPQIERVTRQYDVQIYVENNSISGLVLFQKVLPCMVLVDNDISDMVGLSTAAIIKETVIKEQYKCAVYVLNVSSFLDNIRADRIFSVAETESADIVIASVKSYLENRSNHMMYSDDIKRAKGQQLELIPEPILHRDFEVIPMFSPYHELSGDGIDFWFDESNRRICGFVFDCTGHDLVSFLQSGEIRTMLKGGWRFYKAHYYKTLDEIFNMANTQLFDLHQDQCAPAAAVLFEFALDERVVNFCPAGIPNYLVHECGAPDRREITLRSNLLGFLPDVKFESYSFPLNGIDEVVFSTDGFSELLQVNQAGGPVRSRAKHDDVSAIVFRFLG